MTFLAVFTTVANESQADMLATAAIEQRLAACVQAGGFHFAPLTENHLPLLHTWLTRPHVAEWWQPAPTLAELRAEYFDATDSTRAFIAMRGDEPVGFIQCYVVMGWSGGWWPDETDPGARGIDQFLADGASLGQGLGTQMIRAFVARIFNEDPSVTVVQTDPSPSNARAIACYRKVGFADVGEVITPDGPALLMRRARLT